MTTYNILYMHVRFEREGGRRSERERERERESFCTLEANSLSAFSETFWNMNW